MKSFKRAFLKEKDEYYTPSILVEMLVPYLKKWESDFITKNERTPIIWLPFDTKESKYYQILQNEGFVVTRSHLDDEKDFFKYKPEQFDLIVSNPPFSLKLDIFKRIVLDLKKPFCLLMNIMALNYQEIGKFFAEIGTDIQFIIPDKKVSFDGNTSSFCSGYVCYKFVEKTEFIHLPHNNTGANFWR